MNRPHRLTSFILTAAVFFTPIAFAFNVEHEVEELLESVESKNIDPTMFEEVNYKVLSLAIEAVEEIVHDNPDSAQLFEILFSAVATKQGHDVVSLGSIKTLSAEEAMSYYSDLEFVDEVDVGIDIWDEEYEHLHDAIHLLLHPAISVLLAREYVKTGDEDLLSILSEELHEVIEHYEEVVEGVEGGDH
ncbi:MAG: hypothetical protein HRU38_24440 [Saccharospirillaceae bacterium]|nr:hypothetical protein [Pseudomonadales bacterium]NRB81771.1 hypothetical protein [Saccharospirillaceae bacterium]